MAHENPLLADVVSALERWYPPALAESWDHVGLVAGDPRDVVHTVLCAVDPVASVVDEAIDLGAQLLVVHHPLFFRPTHSVAASGFKGSVVHRLVRAGCALFTAHTNADVAADGVNDRLAKLLGIAVNGPLRETSSGEGLGRIGTLHEPMSLRSFAELVAERLPATHHGVRVAGPPDALVTTVAVCSGSGDGEFDAARASNADVYLTADLRHHPASEAREHSAGNTPYLVDVSHWASEWPWVPAVAERLSGLGLTVHQSAQCTDPWVFRVASTQDPQIYGDPSVPRSTVDPLPHHDEEKR